MAAPLGYQIPLTLAVGLPLAAAVATLALTQKLGSKEQYDREKKALYIAVASLITVLVVLSLPLNPFFFGGLQFGVLLLSIPVFIFLFWQLFYFFQCGIERGRALAALVLWLLAILVWSLHFLF